MTAGHTQYGPGELLKKATGLYARRRDPRYDILIEVAQLLRDDKCRTQDLLRLILVDGVTYLVEEKRGDTYQVVFRASYAGGTLQFHENLEGGWRNALARWSETEFPNPI
jgi:hypothetical protein